MSGVRRRYRFIREIAEGGFGKVYLAEQLSQDGFSRIVALKLLHQKWASHAEIVSRTRDEARLLGLIRHQHIVRVEDLTSIDGKLAIVMEYLEGVDLKSIMGHLIDSGAIFPRHALFEIMIAVCSALDAAYNGEPLQGGEPLHVLHRDIKPSNIFLTTNGGVKLLDFGTARANFEAREARTQALAFGSQGYMAPERMLGEEDTPAADIFSLGVTLQEMLSLEPFGRIPPRPNKFAEKIEEKIASTPLRGSPEWVDEVRSVLRAMMAYESTDRPAAKQLVDTFEGLAQGAGDDGVRRFCRVAVAAAKEREPPLEDEDELVGALIEEDTSSVWGIEPALTHDGALPREEGPSMAPGGMRAPSGLGEEDPSQSHTFSDVREITGRRSKRQRGSWTWVVLGALTVLTLGFLSALLVAAGVALWLFVGVETPGEQPSAATTPAADDAPEQRVVGGRVVDAGRVPPDPSAYAREVRLTLQGDSEAAVTISGSLGLKAEWDGASSFDLGRVPAGRYRAIVTPRSTGEKIRGTTFEVLAGKSCAFAFDVGRRAWVGGCQ